MKSSDQDVFSSIKNFDPGRRWFYKSIGSDYPLSMDEDILMKFTIDTITLPGLETEVAVTDIRVSRDVISHATVTLFSST